MKAPDVVGMYLAEAKARLEGSGVSSINTRLTAQPRHKCTESDDTSRYRVVRVRIIDYKQVELLVCDPSI